MPPPPPSGHRPPHHQRRRPRPHRGRVTASTPGRRRPRYQATVGTARTPLTPHPAPDPRRQHHDQPTHPAPGASSASARPETGPADLLHHAPHPLFSQSDTRLAFTRRSSIIAAEASSAPASMRPRRRYAAIPLSLDKTADTARAPAPETCRDIDPGPRNHHARNSTARATAEQGSSLTTTGAHTADNGDRSRNTPAPRPPYAMARRTCSATRTRTTARTSHPQHEAPAACCTQQRPRQLQACCTPRARTSATCNIPARTRCTARRKP